MLFREEFGIVCRDSISFFSLNNILKVILLHGRVPLCFLALYSQDNLHL